MQKRLLMLVGVASCLGALALCGCWTPPVSSLFNSPPSPELTVTPPASITGGQPSHWVFSWSKGAGWPYTLEVTMQPGHMEPGGIFSYSADEPISWEESSIVSFTLEHDFVLPNASDEILTYWVTVKLIDNRGPSEPGYLDIWGYDSSDDTGLFVTVQPSP